MYSAMARHGGAHTHTTVIPALTWETKVAESGAQDRPRLQRASLLWGGGFKLYSCTTL